MRCPEMIERLTDKLHGKLESASARELAEHLSSCPACRSEAEEIERMWHQLGRLEETEDVPTGRMRVRLWSALSVYEEGRATFGGRLRRAIERVWPREPAWQLGLTAAALVVGLLAGGRLAPTPAPPTAAAPASDTSAEIAALRGELHSMQETISLSLLQHQSASERLRGVDMSARVGPDERVIGALLETVQHDENDNVRLAAIEALAPVVAQPLVSRELLEVLGRQDSTLVRVSLAELLLRSGVPGAEQAVRQLVAGDELEPQARDYLRTLMRQSG